MRVISTSRNGKRIGCSRIAAAILVLVWGASSAGAACECLVVGAGETKVINGFPKTYECIDVLGVLIIKGTLTLTGPCDSIVSGTVKLTKAASDLRIEPSGGHTISGSGALEGQNDGATITIASGKTLTSAIDITGHLSIEGAGSFQNNGLVCADIAGGTLDIAVGGTVDDSTTPADRWKVSASSAVLKFNSAIGTLNSLDGRFVVDAGTLAIDEAMTTDGRLDMSAGILDGSVDVTFNSSDVSGERALIDGGKIQMAAGALFVHK